MRKLAIQEWSDGEIALLATELEPLLIDPGNSRKVVKQLLSKLVRGQVISILEYQGVLWCCTNAGVFCYNVNEAAFVPVEFKENEHGDVTRWSPREDANREGE